MVRAVSVLMKILWASANFLHPTNKGGQIRTLGMLRQMHKRHEIHYVAFDYGEPEALERAPEYCTKAYPIPHIRQKRRSAAFALEVGQNLVASSMPLPVARYYSPEMETLIRDLRNADRFDLIVCDFLFPAPNFDRLNECVLFEHNVETMIWKRHVDAARNAVERAYFRVQATRMEEYERKICRAVKHTVAVSSIDAEKIRSMFGVTNVSEIGTGVDVEYFTPAVESAPVADLVFVGSMDWMPNIDGVTFFVDDILPLIRKERPDCTVAIVGRTPPPPIAKLPETDAGVLVTGTVPDVRPYLWGSKVSIVPLRIGSGTRLKIYEAMAARMPVVSTMIGAEGLHVNPPHDIRIGDTPAEFATQCLDLLNDADARESVGNAAWELVASKFSWEQVTREFEASLETNALTTSRP